MSREWPWGRRAWRSSGWCPAARRDSGRAGLWGRWLAKLWQCAHLPPIPQPGRALLPVPHAGFPCCPPPHMLELIPIQRALLKFSTPQPRLPIPQPLSIPPPEKYFWQVVILKQKGCLMCHCRERLRPVDEKNKYKADLIRIKPRQSETYTNLRSILVICHSRSVCPIYRLPSER